MINAPRLLADLTRLLKRLEDDLRQRIVEVAELKAGLQAEWQAARDADRTAETFESWADQVITQAGVHWLLSCVFLRFIEDNELIERPWLGGTPQSGRLALARDRHEAWFRERPLLSDRDYLLASFREAGALPGLHTFFDEAHNPVFRLGISGDAAMALRQFWQQVDPNTGALAHDFTDPDWNTRFLGDLYQDLSEAARKRYALLQTPEFVEEFILDRTLTPAIREFGFREVRMIDPTCGSGHFLLGGFRRLADEWLRSEPARNPRDIAQRALDAVFGVDLNPFAVAISRFRLLVAALNVSRVHRLTEAPDFKLNVAIGDSLLHGKRFGMTATDGMFEGAEHYAGTGLAHAYASEDLAEVQRILGRQYHAVVGNPPYIIVRDAALNAAYRARYASCHRQYSLGAPFTERFFDLALTGSDRQSAGYVGLITANSFMKREFGSKLIEHVLPRLDLTHVIDTSGAYIPGHGTPTTILFGRHRSPLGPSVRAVMGIQGEPTAPPDPARGLVWSAIVEQIDRPNSTGQFVSTSDLDRSVLAHHPWSLSGGGGSDLLEHLNAQGDHKLGDISSDMGRTNVVGEDDVWLFDADTGRRRQISRYLVPFVIGEAIRDWDIVDPPYAIYPYDSLGGQAVDPDVPLSRHFWIYRTLLKNRTVFGKSVEERGEPWFVHLEHYRSKLASPLSIAFSFVGTHNHFALDRGGKIFKQSAPVIKLRDKSETLHQDLTAVLNSSVACYWLKQVCHCKGGGGINEGHRGEKWEFFYEFPTTSVAEFPLPRNCRPSMAIEMEALARRLASLQPLAVLNKDPIDSVGGLKHRLAASQDEAVKTRRKMISMQEELDWQCYQVYGLCAERLHHLTPPAISQGERAFEIVFARRMAAGIESTTWFERHGITPITEIPTSWPEDYRDVVERRIKLIESDANIALIERPEYKRRWNSPSWESMQRDALRSWLLSRLEAPRYWTATADEPTQLTSTSRLADAARGDASFIHVATVYSGHSDFDLNQLVSELVESAAVPFLPVLRYTESGLRKRAQWEGVWRLQRCEDDGEDVGKIPVPPRFQNKDFQKANFWHLRGSLDAPKERWISYPGCERGADGSLVVAWAGWNHLQQATALAAYYLEMKENEGWEPARLQPLLAGLLELVPWLEQWHNEIDPAYGERMGTYYRGFVNEEARALGFTLDDLRAWKPVVTAAKRGRKKAAQPS
ncbi:MAG TPA: BREX-2 system adenine-specific DNA-methyltransferase PglX [Gammaproteobacteria bacterium]|nr:BREX-2 system adenine-specific DNA-methyltransferase PglX [Gammaproteobacteria bacterium]